MAVTSTSIASKDKARELRAKRKSGRPKGSPNKATANIRAMVEGALSRLGGEDWLISCAREDPKTFIPLVARILPQKLEVDAGDKLAAAMGAALKEADGD